MRGVYYNEHDVYAAQWLRNLIAAGHIAAGDVDERSIVDVQPDDLRGYRQCHFFAGIGGWSAALRLAGWPDDRPVWTGSCPCQPFSQAGKGRGHQDERHLWPAWFRLIQERGPRRVYGEQVASADGLAWFDVVSADLEHEAYAVAAADICAAGVGAPHIRQRIFFVADDTGAGRQWWWRDGLTHRRAAAQLERLRPACRLADDDGSGRRVERAPRLHADETRGLDYADEPGRSRGERGTEAARHGRARAVEAGAVDGSGRMGDTSEHGVGQHTGELHRDEGQHEERAAIGDHASEHPGAAGYWDQVEWVWCRDGKWRPVESGTQPLAHGVPNRMAKLRALGNAIVPQAAAQVIMATMP